MAKILIVDDRAINREFLVTLLGYNGHQMLEARDGTEGLRLACEEKPDLVIADILMPNMNGYEFVFRLRREPDIAATKVVFYSASFLDNETEALARACGVRQILPKGTDPEHVLSLVNEALAPSEPGEPRGAAEKQSPIDVVQVLNQKLFEKIKELDDLNASLERRVAERTWELQEQMREREKAELQLRQVQRLDAIGKLAGGVAHDFNNLLGVILGQSEILLEHVRDPATTRGLEMIRESARRGAGLTRQLLAFGRRQVMEAKVISLNAVLTDIQKLLRRVIGEDVELEFQTEPKLHNVEADPGQLEQVILNLAINARDAMPSGGKLRISTANADLTEDYVAQHPIVPPGRYAQLAVSDTGCGMDAQTQARIFEPFFTTKEPGKGTGLGLATVYGIVKQSGGYIWVYSEVGHGTTFRLYFPVVETSRKQPRRVESSQAPGGSETILVVEDDEGLREVTCEFLRSGGYKVIAAESPERALELAERHNGTIDFLLTDVIMPKLNGRELAAKVAKLRPEIRVLFVSGYADGILRSGAAGAREESVAFLQKPYTRQELTRKVREILDAQPVRPS